MRENDIRSDLLRVESRRLYKIDQKKLLDQKGAFVEIDCPACGSSVRELFYERDGFFFQICAACSTVFVSPRPDRDMLFEHYRTSLSEKFWNEKIYPESESSRIKHLILPRIDRIVEICNRNGISRGTLVDVGAGCGMLLDQARKTGAFKKTLGVEPDPSSADSCRRRGLEVLEDFVENISGVRADVVTSIESIEHVFDAGQYLKSIHNMLNPEGLIILTTPNIKGFDLITLRDRSNNTSAPDHLNYFHPDSISILLEKSGFEVLEIETPGKLDAELVRNTALAGDFSLQKQPFLKRILVDEPEKYMDSFQKWLSENGLSSHMWAVARKRNLQPPFGNA